MSIVNRIKLFIEKKGISVRKFEEKVGFSNGAFASQYKNNKTIGSDKIENILQEYPEINSEWLLTGKGEMFKSGINGDRNNSMINSGVSGNNNVFNNGGTNSVVMGDSNVYSSPNDEIQALRKENEYLKQLVEQQKETIAVYKQLNNK